MKDTLLDSSRCDALPQPAGEPVDGHWATVSRTAQHRQWLASRRRAGAANHDRPSYARQDRQENRPEARRPVGEPEEGQLCRRAPPVGLGLPREAFAECSHLRDDRWSESLSTLISMHDSIARL